MRTLSSRATFYAKFVVSGFFIVFGILFLVVVGRFVLESPAAGGPLAGLFLLLWLGLALCYVMRAASWKRVRMDLDSLYVSNYFSEIRVPLLQVTEVRQRRGWPSTITIRLREPGAFGSLIAFHPRLWLVFWRQHPVVEELRQLAGGAVLTPQQLQGAIRAERKQLWAFMGVLLGFFVALFVLLQVIFRHSDAYRMGLQAAAQDTAVIQALGAPIRPGWFAAGDIQITGSGGCAVLDFPLDGSLARGHVYINAARAGGAWHLSYVRVEVPQSRQGTIEVVPRAQPAPDSRCAESNQQRQGGQASSAHAD